MSGNSFAKSANVAMGETPVVPLDPTLNIVSPSEIKRLFPQYIDLLKFGRQIYCDEVGVLRFVPNELVRWSIQSGSMSLKRLEQAHHDEEFSTKEYLGFLLGAGFPLDLFLDIPVVMRLLGRNAKAQNYMKSSGRHQVIREAYEAATATA
jgi:hypothetical protein